jgi:hypothetical protein
MSRKYYTPEQIIGKLREAEVALAQGEKAGQVCRTLAPSSRNYARHSFFTAMASISTDTFRGRPATWTVVRAGGCWGKNSP